jgi:hypothetical protein
MRSLLFLALGLAAAAWARLEKHINSILIQVNKRQHSNEITALYDPNYPTKFSDKIRLLKKYFNQHPALKDFREKITNFASDAKKLSIDRNIYLHSVIQSYDKDAKILELLSI